MSRHYFDQHLVVTCDSLDATAATVTIDGAVQDDVVSVEVELRAGQATKAHVTRFVPQVDLDVMANIHEESILERAFSQWALSEMPDANPGAAAAHLAALLSRGGS